MRVELDEQFNFRKYKQSLGHKLGHYRSHTLCFNIWIRRNNLRKLSHLFCLLCVRSAAHSMLRHGPPLPYLYPYAPVEWFHKGGARIVPRLVLRTEFLPYTPGCFQ